MQNIRLGTYFRKHLLEKLGIKSSSNDSILDVGCFDGYWLSTQKAQKKVGLDIDIKKRYKNIKYIQASALDIPLDNSLFDKVFAFDVIEHVPKNAEKIFLSELIRVVKNKGNIYLTFPSNKIKIFPWFLTKYISRRWGHFKYLGLSQKMIENFLADFKNIKYEIITLNTRYYLNYYLLLRIFWLLNPKITKIFLKYIIKKDFKNLKGENGYFLVIIKKNEIKLHQAIYKLLNFKKP